MAEPVDYFSNHRYKSRFPWRLYHDPIVSALRAVVRDVPGERMLNLGSGPFFELGELPDFDKELTICDIDRRAIELARSLHGSRIRQADVIRPNEPLPYSDEAFDLIVSMDVIEHVPDPEPWLREALRVLRPTGTIFLTTPNYDSRSLRLLEATVLEAVARAQGFSRKLLHPSKMTPARLSALLARTTAGRSEISSIAFGWVLAAKTTKFR